ncbi:MAG: bifunctional proline dehydrogenase/L-glutamate gamma-semialdehyde dehydrogenase [Simkaniaceae bacterium]|nr:bifunctional proline dehydrogenase/L-glutamate gamma-semialdehyde dehydrogenase [Simkaniaceae bacterium]
MSEQSRSEHMRSAEAILASARTHPMSMEERTEKAIMLASHIIPEADSRQSEKERKRQRELARMMGDRTGKAFMTAMTDGCFRSTDPYRTANRMIDTLNKFGIPRFLSPWKKLRLHLLKVLAEKMPHLIVPLALRELRKETSHVIVPGERATLIKHVQERQVEGVRLNINHLGEAILGEEEANKQLNVYLDDLKQPHIDYVSIKISTIYSQINPLAWNDTLERLGNQLRRLYRAAMIHPLRTPPENASFKFVNLDMEEFHDLRLTKELFVKVLDEEEFLPLSAGIVLQAYLPDSYTILQELTDWARGRIKRGGAPIKIRIVKGANLAMEQIDASLRGLPQTPYTQKIETDAAFKSMLLYALKPEHTEAVKIGVGSHNLFDIAFAMLLRAENEVEGAVSFEMLEGMADHTRKVVHELTGGLLLYCAVAKREDFQNAIAYLIRRLDENTGEENFLANSFNLTPTSEAWHKQVTFFRDSCKMVETLSHSPRRQQNRFLPPPPPREIFEPFENEQDTDFSLTENRKWAEQLLEERKNRPVDPIPLVINGKEILHKEPQGVGYDPSHPDKACYSYSLASLEEAKQALACARNRREPWRRTPVRERVRLIGATAHELRKKRADLIGAMLLDGGKIISEADTEHSEAVDFLEYYLRSMIDIGKIRDIEWSPKGTVLIAPPWNFPVAIPAGGISAALLTGNTVLFKPAPESVLAGFEMVRTFWQAGIPKKLLQFLPCEEDPVGNMLIRDPGVDTVILTGSTATARLFKKMRPDLDLHAETGGKNALIVSSLADRDLAVRSLVLSAFGHNGQKCSAASLAILEKEVYDSSAFRTRLRDAVASLRVGSAWDPASRITPLIKPPGEDLQRALTTLEPGEFWLLQPKRDSDNPALWSPGIKFGVRKKSYTHQTEFFGPLLGVMRADSVDHAIHLANATPYGLTSGIHSLDKSEVKKWQKLIIAGNCYVNRTITGAIVGRQPFGGCKNSGYGPEIKSGGPHYLIRLMHAEQKGTPQEKFPVNTWVNNLTHFLDRFELSTEELGMWYAATSSYAFFRQQFKKGKDRFKIVGQDNFLRYLPLKKPVFRIGAHTVPLDYLRVFAAALTCGTRLEVSWEKGSRIPQTHWEALLPGFTVIEEDEPTFIRRLHQNRFKRIRMLEKPSCALETAAAEYGTHIDYAPVLANGRVELLRYLREVSISIDYHRYGNLGLRENELRQPIR